MAEQQGQGCQHEMTAEYMKMRSGAGYFCENCGTEMAWMPAAVLTNHDRLVQALERVGQSYHLVCSAHGSESGSHTEPTFKTCSYGRCPETQAALDALKEKV